MANIRIVEATTEPQRRGVLHIAHAAYDIAHSWSWYAALRLADPRRADARWWMLLEGGVAASALIAYPLRLSANERSEEAVGIGSVATVPTHRRRGHASRLIAHVLDTGPGDALLFSAIGPGPYTSLGFRVLPAWEWRHPDPVALLSDTDSAALRPLDPRRERDLLREARSTHARGLHLARDGVGWDRTLARHPDHRWFAVEGGGVLRLSREDRTVCVEEVWVPEPNRDATIRAAAGIAATLDCAIEGWFAPTPWVESVFEGGERSRAIPMVRGDWPGDAPELHPVDHF